MNGTLSLIRKNEKVEWKKLGLGLPEFNLLSSLFLWVGQIGCWTSIDVCALDFSMIEKETSRLQTIVCFLNTFHNSFHNRPKIDLVESQTGDSIQQVLNVSGRTRMSMGSTDKDVLICVQIWSIFGLKYAYDLSSTEGNVPLIYYDI